MKNYLIKKDKKLKKCNKIIKDYQQVERASSQTVNISNTICKKVMDNLKSNEPKNTATAFTATNFNGKSIDFSQYHFPLMKKFAWNEEKKKFEFYGGKNTHNILNGLKINPVEVDVAKENILQVKNIDHVVDILVNHFTNELVLARNLLYFKTVYLEEKRLKKEYENEVKNLKNNGI